VLEVFLLLQKEKKEVNLRWIAISIAIHLLVLLIPFSYFQKDIKPPIIKITYEFKRKIEESPLERKIKRKGLLNNFLLEERSIHHNENIFEKRASAFYKASSKNNTTTLKNVINFDFVSSQIKTFSLPSEVKTRVFQPRESFKGFFLQKNSLIEDEGEKDIAKGRKGMIFIEGRKSFSLRSVPFKSFSFKIARRYIYQRNLCLKIGAFFSESMYKIRRSFSHSALSREYVKLSDIINPRKIKEKRYYPLIEHSSSAHFGLLHPLHSLSDRSKIISYSRSSLIAPTVKRTLPVDTDEKLPFASPPSQKRLYSYPIEKYNSLIIHEFKIHRSSNPLEKKVSPNRKIFPLSENILPTSFPSSPIFKSPFHNRPDRASFILFRKPSLPPREGERKIFSPPSPPFLIKTSFLSRRSKSYIFPIPFPLSSNENIINKAQIIFPQRHTDSALLIDYLKKIRAIIQKNKKYPPSAKNEGKEGKVKISFTISKSGKVLDVVILSSSKHPELNEAAKTLIYELSPFPPFPEKINKKSIRLNMEVIYELKE